MIEIHQSIYNSDELAWEVINAIADEIRAIDEWTDALAAQFAQDYAVFRKYAADDSAQTYADEPGMREIEDDWHRLGAACGIVVYDDGEAGWTYVGTEGEIEEFLKDQDEEEGD